MKPTQRTWKAFSLARIAWLPMLVTDGALAAGCPSSCANDGDVDEDAGGRDILTHAGTTIRSLFVATKAP